jgi:UPF0755 protein
MRSFIKYFLIFFILTVVTFAFLLNKWVFEPTLKNISDHKTILIHTPIPFEKLLTDTLYLESNVTNKLVIKVLSKLKRMPENIKPGRYVVKQSMSNNDLLNMFRSGIQEPVMLTFNSIRTKEQLAGKIGSQLLADSTAIIETFNNSQLLSSLGLSAEWAYIQFLPDSYEVFWTISPEQLLKRMQLEFNKFWNDSRAEAAKKINLTPFEIITLASIVEEESNVIAEYPIIAGLYLNRLRRGMLLQADPTVKFAIGDMEKRRILNVDKLVDSPYNTYKYSGLPPGPLRIPSKITIDAVLNHKKHSYLFMCAKADFSGLHHFSETLSEHNRYARLYQQTLNKLRIYK